MLTLLALLSVPPDNDANYIRLNAIISRDLGTSGQEAIAQSADTVRFDLPVPGEMWIERPPARRP